MKKVISVIKSFSKKEICLWSSSVCMIIVSFCIFDRESWLVLAASIIGATSLIFNSKGNPLGQLLMIIFSICYGIISYGYSYYGEMITYLGMTAPMSLMALVSWMKNPYKGNDSDAAEVEVNKIEKREFVFLSAVTVPVTVIFYYILGIFGTANLIPSTISVTTSFMAAYLTFRRSIYFALFYAANDIVLIILWIMAAIYDISYVSVVIYFAAFLVNDLYCFVNWRKISERQSEMSESV